MRFKPMGHIGNDWKGKYVKFNGYGSRENINRLGEKVSLTRGAIGFCYSANRGTIFVGFGENLLSAPPSALDSPMQVTRYRYAVVFNVSDLDKLQLQD